MIYDSQPSPFRWEKSQCVNCNGQGGRHEQVRAMQGKVIEEWQPCLLCGGEAEIETLYCADLITQHPYHVCSREEN